MSSWWSGERADRSGEQAPQGEDPAKLGERWAAVLPRGEGSKPSAGGHAGRTPMGVPGPSALQTWYAKAGGAA